jgi:hypothetical protein
VACFIDSRRPTMPLKPKASKKARSKTVDPEQSARHLCLKALRKTTKQVKNFLVQRCARRKDKEDALIELQQIKKMDHSRLAEVVFETSFGESRIESAIISDVFLARVMESFAAEEAPESVVCRMYLQHKVLVEVVAEWKAKVDAAIQRKKRTIRRTEEKKAAAALKVQPHFGIKDRVKAVFVDSLQEQDEKDQEMRKRKREELKAQQGRQQKKQTPKQDLSRYGPPKEVQQHQQHQQHQQQQLHQQIRWRQAEQPRQQAAADDIHPSWAAKQRQKVPAIVASTNKKIVFED